MAYQQPGSSTSFWIRTRPVSPDDETVPCAPPRSRTPMSAEGGYEIVDDDSFDLLDEGSLEPNHHMVDMSEQVTVLDAPVDHTLREKAARVAGLKPASSAVRCAIPVTLRMLTGNPRGLITLLDVNAAVVQAEHALPDQASVWIRLPFASGSEVVRGRVKCSDRRSPQSPWEALVKLEVGDPATRDGLVKLVRALKGRAKR